MVMLRLKTVLLCSTWLLLTMPLLMRTTTNW
jgi:hypothetical protein